MVRRQEQIFLQKSYLDDQQTHEKMLNITHHQEVHIKSTMGYHLTPVRMAKVNNTRNKGWCRCEGKGILMHCWQECKLVQPLWKTVWRVLKKLKTELPITQQLHQLGIHPKDTKILIRRSTCTLMLTAASSTIAKSWKEP